MFGNPAASGQSTQVTTGNNQLKTGQGLLSGLLCSTSSSMVISVYDGTSASGKALVSSMPIAASTPYPIPVKFNVGLFVVVNSGSGNATFFWD